MLCTDLLKCDDDGDDDDNDDIQGVGMIHNFLFAVFVNNLIIVYFGQQWVPWYWYSPVTIITDAAASQTNVNSSSSSKIADAQRVRVIVLTCVTVFIIISVPAPPHAISTHVGDSETLEKWFSAGVIR